MTVSDYIFTAKYVYMTYEANRRVETSVRTFTIIEQLAKHDSIGVSELADALNMSKGIVHNHVSTLRELGYVRKTQSGYQLSPKLLTTGYRAKENSELYQHANASIRGFSTELSVGAFLVTPTESECIVLIIHGMADSVELSVGTQLPLTESLVGVAGLAVSDDNDLDSTATEWVEIEQISSAIDSHGYATGPVAEGINEQCVAVPILNSDEEWCGSVGVLLHSGDQTQHRNRVIDATVSLRDRIEARLRSEWMEERSFATEKHSWIG